MGERNEEPRFNAMAVAFAIGLACTLGLAAVAAAGLMFFVRVFVSILTAVQW